MLPKIGQTVEIISFTDETGNKDYLGLSGKVTHFDYACGCGQSYPDDPMIGVQFNDGMVEEFWREELEISL